MSKSPGLVLKLHHSRKATTVAPEYRAITQGGERDEWAVVNGHGTVVYRGDARVAAMIATRLTRPAR